MAYQQQQGGGRTRGPILRTDRFGNTVVIVPMKDAIKGDGFTGYAELGGKLYRVYMNKPQDSRTDSKGRVTRWMLSFREAKRPQGI